MVGTNQVYKEDELAIGEELRVAFFVTLAWQQEYIMPKCKNNRVFITGMFGGFEKFLYVCEKFNLKSHFGKEGNDNGFHVPFTYLP